MALRPPYHSSIEQYLPPLLVPDGSRAIQLLVNYAELLAPFVDGILQQASLDARKQFELLLAEQAAAAVEADRNDEVLTVQQAADILGMRPQTVYEWIKAGKLPSYNMGRSVRLKRGQVLAALQAQTQPDGRRKYARRATTNKKTR
jgi:excisionase family DNA binding protein